MKKILLNYPLSIVIIAVIWVVCLIPVPEVPIKDFRFIDKWTHFVMYATLTITIWWEYSRHHNRVCWQRLIVGGIICPIIMGCLVELAQAHLTTCRSGDWFDALCNSLGVLLGTGIARFKVKNEE